MVEIMKVSFFKHFNIAYCYKLIKKHTHSLLSYQFLYFQNLINQNISNDYNYLVFGGGMFYLVWFIYLVKANENKVGFFFVDKDQHMSIDVSKPFHSIKDAYLMEKTKAKDETDYVNTKSILKFTRTIRDEDAYKEHQKLLRDIPNTSDSYYELRRKEFKTIFVDMKAVEKNPKTTFTFNFKTDNNLEIITRPFHYSEKNNRWELGVAESGNHMKWVYIGGGAAALLIIGAIMVFAS